MKVLNVVSSMKPESGGISQGLRNIIPALADIGVYNEVVCFDDAGCDFIKKDNFIIHALGEAKGPYAYNKNFSEWMSQNLGRFDVVIIQGLWLYSSFGTYRAWKKYKKTNAKYPKLFAMPHGMLDPYFQKAKERRVKALRNTIFYALFENKVINNSNGLLFTCEQELILAREPFKPYKPKAELNVGYGIQPPPEFAVQMTDAFYSKCEGLKKGEPFILFISRVHHKKGVDLLIKAYNTLSAEPALPKLVIAGPGMDTDYGMQLKTLAGRNENIIFPGMLSGDSKWGAFYNCEAFILPSHQENFGIAVVEAMACDKPVLITDKINIFREIENGRGGIIQNDDLEGASMLLKQWGALNENQKKEMGKNAFEAYKENFSINYAAKKLKNALVSQING